MSLLPAPPRFTDTISRGGTVTEFIASVERDGNRRTRLRTKCLASRGRHKESVIF